MVQIRKAYTHSLIALLFAPLVGCGSSTPLQPANTAGPSGRSIQGAVNGATIWADDLGSGIRFSLDTSEQGTKATTNSNGAFTLPVTPGYKYMFVSQAGIDTITGNTATTMIAPGGAKIISPLTTLVTLDTSGNLLTILKGILPGGASFDTDFTVNAGLSQAAMVFLTSVTTAVTTFNAAIQDAAKKSNATLSAAQLNDINLTLYSQMAIQFSTLSAATLSNTASLATNLQAALTAAITTIAANNSANIAGLDPTTMGATIANNSVAAAAQVVGNATGNASLKAVTAANVQQSPGVTVSQTSTVTESSVLTPANTAIVTSTITNVGASTSVGVTITSTPPNYSPPPIPVVNNPDIIGYNLVALPNNGSWNIARFTITFSDDMVASESGGTNYNHSVLNPANYVFSKPGCSPTSYASNVVTFTCGTLSPGNFVVTVVASSATGGVWASSTSLGLLVDNIKTFVLPIITGSTGGSNLNLF